MFVYVSIFCLTFHFFVYIYLLLCLFLCLLASLLACTLVYLCMSLAHSLIRSLTHLPTHSLIHPFIHSPIHSLTHPVSQAAVNALYTHLLSDIRAPPMASSPMPSSRRRRTEVSLDVACVACSHVYTSHITCERKDDLSPRNTGDLAPTTDEVQLDVNIIVAEYITTSGCESVGVTSCDVDKSLIHL